MRFTRYFAALITLFVVTSCVNNDIDILAPSASADSGAVTICGRITSFDDHAVTTRAGKTNEESYSSSMAMAIFPIDEINGELDTCISYIHLQGSNVNFTIDRKKLREEYGDVHDNKPFALYLFANMPELPANMAGLREKGLKSLADFMELAYANSGIRRPQKGFPMVGSLGDYITAGADGKKFVLIPTTGEEPNVKITLPLVDNDPSAGNDGEPSDYIPIPLKALYAKFSFVITLEPDQHIQNGATPTFTLENYVLKNVPGQVCAGASYNGSSTVLGGEITTPVGTSVTEGGELKFDFYLPERFLKPNISAENFQYPLGGEEEGALVYVNGYSNVRDEDKKYCQRFKPDLVTDGQKATYITLNGHYSDHQGHNWTVTYDIYLGEDNYGNFDFKRNTNYINSVVIRGIKAYKHEDLGDVYRPYIDHRVSVEGALDIIISLQRETLLDSHFEVRPLRVRYPLAAGQSVPAGAKVTVEVLDELGNSFSTSDSYPNWVRIEHRNAGTGSDTHLASGKRRYFTTDLVTNTLNNANGRLSTVTLSGTNQETFWIYVDQCDDVAPTNDKNKVRKAKIRVTYDDNASDPKAMEYMLCQHLLYPVTDDNGVVKYCIEYEEEYLYNYDIEDSYGQTKVQGMPWGLNEVQLSNEHNSFYINENNTEWNNYVQNSSLLKYDFYIEKYDDFVDASKIEVHNFAGQHFTEDIYKKSGGNVKYLTLADPASGAVEYCYSRNKKKTDGTVDVKWYLPAADELEDIIVAAYGDFKEFQDNYYWTSQPAYIRNAFYYEYHNGSRSSAAVDAYAFISYEDNKNYARATKVVRENNQYSYAKSGLNKLPANGGHDMDADCINKNATSLGYFNVMYGWYRWQEWWQTKPQTEIKEMNADDHFDSRHDGEADNTRYHVHLGHLTDLMQEGYQPRTKSNRVRCARVVPQ